MGPPKPPPPTEPATPSDLELFYQATLAAERGELEASREALGQLLARTPDFEGAKELLARVNRRTVPPLTPPPRTKEVLRREPETTPQAKPEQPAPAVAAAPTEADLFYQARVAFEADDLKTSEECLERLLARNPSFEGAEELMTEVTDLRWRRKLPMSLSARHNHRLGGCQES